VGLNGRSSSMLLSGINYTRHEHLQITTQLHPHSILSPIHSFCLLSPATNKKKCSFTQDICLIFIRFSFLLFFFFFFLLSDSFASSFFLAILQTPHKQSNKMDLQEESALALSIPLALHPNNENVASGGYLLNFHYAQSYRRASRLGQKATLLFRKALPETNPGK